TVDSPYTAGAAPVPGYVLSCLDCHEPHGSTNNVFLIRTEVNDTNLAGSITSFSTASWRYLCARCHDDNNKSIHHDNNDWAYIEQKSCGDCHGGYPITCSNCHYHNSSKTNCNNPALPATRDTF
ncbi:MAG: cytochrome c3 family protein, partial [Proteobacteria bacterium]|nr:cytochrome c3 family protein [Pseudomonadota bacterium]MBU4414039.1 cytochrome c3 family protein [Pseudomonadota bacterium]